MASGDCSSDVSDGSYDSNDGEFPNGYCIWDLSTLQKISTHCAPGFSCSGAPPSSAKARFTGDCVKIGCTPDP